MHEGTWNKWREAGKPDDWKIMTKVEHTKRTAEYLALVEKENPRGMRKATADASQMPHIARPAALPVASEALPEDQNVKVEGKKKRRRRKPAKVDDNTGNDADADADTAEGQVNQNKDDTPDAGMEDAPREVPLDDAVPGGNKKKRKRRKSGKSNSNVDDVTTDAVATADDSEPSRKRRR